MSTKLKKVDLNIDLNLKGTSDNPFTKTKYTGKIQDDYPSERAEILKSLKARKADEAKRMRLATDSEFWFAVVFQSREQKEAFLKATKLDMFGDKYLDGKQVAKMMKVDLPQQEPSYQGQKEAKRLVSEIGLIPRKDGE